MDLPTNNIYGTTNSSISAHRYVAMLDHLAETAAREALERVSVKSTRYKLSDQ